MLQVTSTTCTASIHATAPGLSSVQRVSCPLHAPRWVLPRLQMGNFTCLEEWAFGIKQVLQCCHIPSDVTVLRCNVVGPLENEVTQEMSAFLQLVAVGCVRLKMRFLTNRGQSRRAQLQDIF